MICGLVLAPLIVGFWLYLLPRRAEWTARGIGIAVALINLGYALQLKDQPDESIPWFLHPFAASFHVGLGRGLALWLVLLSALTTACALLSTRVVRQRDFTALMLMLLGSMTGVFIARDLLLFALFFDLMLIPVFFLMVAWGPQTNSAWRYLIYNVTGGLGLLLAAAAFGVLHGTTDVIGKAVADGVSELDSPYEAWIFAGFALAFLIKTPVWPFHTWMPDTYADLPSPVVAVVSAIQSKAGLYGFIAIGLAFFPRIMHQAAPVMFVLGAIGLVYGALVALTQDDVKRIVAYSSLSHLGLIVLAIFSFNPIALGGACVYILAHGLFSAALFLILGSIEQREETRLLSRLGGLGTQSPRLAGALIIAALAALGLPGLCGFAGELLILTGLYKAGFVWQAVLALLPIILASAYMLRLFQGLMHGPVIVGARVSKDLTWFEGVALAPLVVAIVLLGVNVAPVARVEPQLVRQVGLDRGCLPNAAPSSAGVQVSPATGLNAEQTADVLTACYALIATGQITDFVALSGDYLRGRQLLAPYERTR